MSCLQAWEPKGATQAWTTRERHTLDWQKPCQRPSYYYTEAAPQGWSYYLPHDNPTTQPNAYYRFPMYGANYIYRQEGNFYSEPKGCCITKQGPVDGLNSSGCLYLPFYAGAKCAEVAEMGFNTNTNRTFASNTTPEQSEFQPWKNLEQTWDTLFNNWKYNRPGYND